MESIFSITFELDKRFKIIVLLFVFFLFFVSFFQFIVKYTSLAGSSTYDLTFYITFYVFFVFSLLSVAGILAVRNCISAVFFTCIAFIFVTLLGYSLVDYLTIKVWLYSALIISFSMRFTWPANVIFISILAPLCIALQYLPPFIGKSIFIPDSVSAGITISESICFSVLILLLPVFSANVKHHFENWQRVVRQNELLCSTITKLSDFNQSLQNYARTVGVQAVEGERYRMSREIHDISGYIFTNIIAMMDALVSTGCQSPNTMLEMCSGARNQAQEGLQETRKSLHVLRTLEEDQETGIKQIYKIINIFKQITGVAVEIEIGNMPASFGKDIDLIIYRIVQEGLVNALRHGHATKVKILFWIVRESIQIVMQDNGSGVKNLVKGIGLAGMEERISQVKGTVVAMNSPIGGFQLTVTIPLAKSETSSEVKKHDQNSAR